MDSLKNKSIIIKLGGNCNLNCKHCHCLKTTYCFNEDIIKYIKSNTFQRVTFCGGEPLMYFDTIKHIVEQLGNNYTYKFVTNATLLNQDMVDFFNQYRFHVGMSYDGENHSRDDKFIADWGLMSKINFNGLSVLYSKDNDNVSLLDEEIKRLHYNWNINGSENYWLNFCHQTNIAPNDEITKEVAQNYCQFMAIKLEFEFKDYIRKGKIVDKDMPVLSNAFKKWIKRKNERGVACCREGLVNLAVNGDFLLCPYGDIKVGDIYTGVDWNLVESYIPERCKNCSQWGSCHNTCIANITDNECYISKVMYKHFYKLMAKYNVTYEELESKINF